jgi:WD40 repeat protein
MAVQVAGGAGYMDADILFDRTAMAIPIPYADLGVRAALRILGEPTTLFGEIPVDRRRRLQRACAVRGLDAPPALPAIGSDAAQAAARPQKEFLSRGPSGLEERRREIAHATFGAAKARLSALQKEFAVDAKLRDERRRHHNNRLKAATLVRVSHPPPVQRFASVARGGMSFVQIASCAPQSPAAIAAASAAGCAAVLSQLVAAASDDGSVSLWSTRSGARLGVVCEHSQRCSAVSAAWLPTLGRLCIVSGANDASMSISLVNVAAGVSDDALSADAVVTHTVATAHKRRITACAVSDAPGVSIAVTASADGVAKVWDLAKCPTGAPAPLSADAAGPNNTNDATTSAVPLLMALDCCTREAMGIALHPDGSLLAVSDAGGFTYVVDIRTGRTIARCESHLGAAIRCAFAPSGSVLWTGGADGVLKAFDLRSATLRPTPGPRFASTVSPALTVAAHDDWLTSITFVSDAGTMARAVVTTSLDGSVAAFNGETGELLNRFHGSPLTVAADGGPPCAVRSACVAVGETGVLDLVTVAHDSAMRTWALAADDGTPADRTLVTVAAPDVGGTAGGAGTDDSAAAAAAAGGGEDAAGDLSDSDDDLAGLRLG